MMTRGFVSQRLILALTLIVLLPVATMVFLGIRVARDEKTRAEARTDQVLALRLDDVAAVIQRVTEDHEQELLSLLDRDAVDPDALRDASRLSRLVRQMYVVDSQGSLVYPVDPLTEREQASLGRTSSVWQAGGLVAGTDQVEGEKQRTLVPRSTGWHAWFWGEGTQYLFWLETADSGLVAAEVDRSALIAEVLAALPDTPPGIQSRVDAFETRATLTDVNNRTLYQWGTYRPADDELPRASRPLATPFTSWNLRVYAPSGSSLPASTLVNVGAAVLAVTLSVLALAIVLYREGAREIRDAMQKVRFVGRVSHELKTPLTNIRLYAELLHERLAGKDDRVDHQIEVIVSESGRLSRLIQNVLAFAKGEGQGLQLTVGIVDDIVDDVLTAFGPALRDGGLQVVRERGAAGAVWLDRDVLEQILGNLISNVQKYASCGAYLRIATRQSGGRTTIDVEDRGPGISREDRGRVFQPFVRLSSSLTEGVSGAGIGLTICRDLAHSHGGDLTLSAGASGGACFTLTVRTSAEGDDQGRSA